MRSAGSCNVAASGSHATGEGGAAAGSTCGDQTAAGPATRDWHEEDEDAEAESKHGVARDDLGELVVRTLEAYAAALGRSFPGRGQEGEQHGEQQGEGTGAAALVEWYALACEAAGSYAMAVAGPGEQQRLADMLRLNLGPLPATGKTHRCTYRSLVINVASALLPLWL